MQEKRRTPQQKTGEQMRQKPNPATGNHSASKSTFKQSSAKSDPDFSIFRSSSKQCQEKQQRNRKGSRQSIHRRVKQRQENAPEKDKVCKEEQVPMALAGKKTLEAFIDYIESDSLKRKHWLSRVREAGFDQALSEYREMTSPKEMPLQM